MKKAVLALLSASILVTSLAAAWSPDRRIRSVQVADACGAVSGQYAVITDNAGKQYWITSNADNFDNVVAMAQNALIHSRVVNFYSVSESYTVETLRQTGYCHPGGTIANRLSILQMK